MSQCAGGGCCSGDCSCPSHKPNRRPLSNCCYCKEEEDGCSGDAPTTVSSFMADLDAPYNVGCGCMCRNDDAGMEGAYVYTTTDVPIYDAEGKQIGTETRNSGKEWEGDSTCPDHIPDLVKCKCVCLIKVNNGPCDENFIPDPSDENCDCICGLSDSDCPPSEPTVSDDCECVCTVESGDCTGGTPDFDPDICECYCAHARDGDCPADAPEVNSECECYCPITADDCAAGEQFDSASCSCVPCPNSCSGCQTQDDNCDCLGCAGCNDTQYCFGDPETCICCPEGQVECDGACVDNTCPGGQKFDAATCSCVCSSDGKVICNGKCKDPCPPGEGFDANCNCSAAYASSILNTKLLP